MDWIIPGAPCWLEKDDHFHVATVEIVNQTKK